MFCIFIQFKNVKEKICAFNDWMTIQETITALQTSAINTTCQYSSPPHKKPQNRFDLICHRIFGKQARSLCYFVSYSQKCEIQFYTFCK